MFSNVVDMKMEMPGPIEDASDIASVLVEAVLPTELA